MCALEIATLVGLKSTSGQGVATLVAGGNRLAVTRRGEQPEAKEQSE
jgi:hypothetical protein